MFNIFGTRKPAERPSAPGAQTTALAADTLVNLKALQSKNAEYDTRCALLEKQITIAKEKAKAQLAAGNRAAGEHGDTSRNLRLTHPSLRLPHLRHLGACQVP